LAEILPFRPRQLDRILEIERASFPREAYTRKMFKELRRECGPLFLVAKSQGRIAGYIATCRSETGAELISVAVDPRWRGRGLGAALLGHTLALLRASGTPHLDLMVSVGNPDAVRFYRRFGFRRFGTARRYYEDGSDADQMRLRL
jgi:[ribosomal protein S18]-alanine N-acetyltransferase